MESWKPIESRRHRRRGQSPNPAHEDSQRMLRESYAARPAGQQYVPVGAAPAPATPQMQQYAPLPAARQQYVPVGAAPAPATARHRSLADWAPRIGVAAADLEARWNQNEQYDVRKHLFAQYPPDGRVFPAFASTPDVYRAVMDAYVWWYRIPQRAMKEFWMDFVDALLLCHEFEEKARPDFKAWAYGRLCRYVLAERQQIEFSPRHRPYDPVTNFAL